jgi:hypothetical protein
MWPQMQQPLEATIETLMPMTNGKKITMHNETYAKDVGRPFVAQPMKEMEMPMTNVMMGMAHSIICFMDTKSTI